MNYKWIMLHGIKYSYPTEIIFKQFCLIHWWDKQVLSHRVRVDLGVVAMKKYSTLHLLLAQATGSVEYTDCISAEGYHLPLNECPDYDTKLHLIVRL